MLYIPGEENRFYLATGSQSVWSYLQIESSNEFQEGLLPTEYWLSQNHPNPFNGATTIEFALPETGDVSLVIYDILGREVARPVSGYVEAGNHSVTIDMGDAGSGVYFYRLTTAKRTINRSMILLK